MHFLVHPSFYVKFNLILLDIHLLAALLTKNWYRFRFSNTEESLIREEMLSLILPSLSDNNEILIVPFGQTEKKHRGIHRRKYFPSLKFGRADYKIIYKNGRMRIQRSALYIIVQVLNWIKGLFFNKKTKQQKYKLTKKEKSSNDYKSFNQLVLFILTMLFISSWAWVSLLLI